MLKIIWLWCKSLLLNSPLCPIYLWAYRWDIRPIGTCSYHNFRNQECKPSNFFSQGFIGYSEFIAFSYEFWEQLTISIKKAAGILLDNNICFITTGGSDGKESACSAGDPGSIPGSGRSPGEKNGNPRQYACLENPTDRGTWQATVLRVRKSGTWLSD